MTSKIQRKQMLVVKLYHTVCIHACSGYADADMAFLKLDTKTANIIYLAISPRMNMFCICRYNIFKVRCKESKYKLLSYITPLYTYTNDLYMLIWQLESAMYVCSFEMLYIASKTSRQSMEMIGIPNFSGSLKKCCAYLEILLSLSRNYPAISNQTCFRWRLKRRHKLHDKAPLHAIQTYRFAICSFREMSYTCGLDLRGLFFEALTKAGQIFCTLRTVHSMGKIRYVVRVYIHIQFDG